ncbi:MAG: hypothetical protein RLZZ332_994, partial [Actinomycetota bacterium]
MSLRIIELKYLQPKRGDLPKSPRTLSG